MQHLLLLTVFLFGLATADTEICSPGATFSEKYFMYDPGTTYNAIGCMCRYTAGVGFSFYDLSTGDPVHLLVQSNVIVDGGPFQIQFFEPYTGIAEGKQPITVMIRDNIFQQDAYLNIYYTVPANSVITFENNTMSVVATLIEPYVVFFNAPGNQFLANVVFNVVENSMTMINGQGTLRAIAFTNLVFVSTNISINILRNNISTSGDIEGSVVSFARLAFRSSCHLNVLGNNMILSSVSSGLQAIAVEEYCDSTGPEESSLSFSGNNVTAMERSFSGKSLIYLKTASNVRVDLNGNNLGHNYGKVFISDSFLVTRLSFVGNDFDFRNPIETSILDLAK
eukprot:PhF_6_TR22394/c0_g1_i3/m.31779